MELELIQNTINLVQLVREELYTSALRLALCSDNLEAGKLRIQSPLQQKESDPCRRSSRNHKQQPGAIRYTSKDSWPRALFQARGKYKSEGYF